MTSRIDSVALTTFEISPDGECVQLNVRTATGEEATLVLPTLCANQLLVTLPRIIEAALRKSRQNDSLRLAHPLERFSVEPAGGDGGDAKYILTMHTQGDSQVSYAANRDLLGSLVFSIAENVLGNAAEEVHPQLNS